MAFKSDFWVTVGTVAPVLQLTHVVALSRFDHLQEVVLKSASARRVRLIRSPRADEWRDMLAGRPKSSSSVLTELFWSIHIYALRGFVLTISNTIVLVLALVSLSLDSDFAPPWVGVVLLALSAFGVNSQAIRGIVVNRLAREARLSEMEEKPDLPLIDGERPTEADS
jgi:hypothetical protein